MVVRMSPKIWQLPNMSQVFALGECTEPARLEFRVTFLVVNQGDIGKSPTPAPLS